MKTISTILIILITAACSPNKKFTVETNDMNTTELCSKIYPIAWSAVINRKKGISYEEMKASLPNLNEVLKSKNELNKYLPLSMHLIIDEVYNFPVLDPLIYSTYQSERCFHSMKGTPIKQKYDVIHPKISKCEDGNTENYINCTMNVIKIML